MALRSSRDQGDVSELVKYLSTIPRSELSDSLSRSFEEHTTPYSVVHEIREWDEWNREIQEIVNKKLQIK